MRKLLMVMLSLVLVITLVPPGLVQKTNAAVASYFLPDDMEIRNTSQYVITGTTNLLTRANAYRVTNGTLAISGTFSSVASSSLSVKIEQLNLQTDDTWKPDDNRFTTGAIAADTTAGNTNKFIANNLTLFSGMNRITLSGVVGTTTRSDTFYVLFDQVPYVQSIQIRSGSTMLDINEGSRAVIKSETASLQGVVLNASYISFSLNGATAQRVSVYEDGSFFSPPLTFKPGLNTVNLRITNGTDVINIVRDIYYFDTNRPYTAVDIIRDEGGTPPEVYYSIFNKNVPQITKGITYNAATPEYAGLRVQMLVKYNASTFKDTATFRINNLATQYNIKDEVAATDITEQIILAQDGTPEYRLVEFTLKESGAVKYVMTHNGTDYDVLQKVNLSVSYGGDTVGFNGEFKFMPGDTVIKDIKLLPGYDPAVAGTTIANSATKPLRGADLKESTFYILVEADRPIVSVGVPGSIAASQLIAQYLPIGSQTITIDKAVAQPTDRGTNRWVYKISNIAIGQHSVQFKLGAASSSDYVANFSFLSKSYIYVSNLYDGQRYEFSSNASTTPKIDATGEFVDFNTVEAPQFFVNGTEQFTAATAPTGITPTVTLTGNKFKMDLEITQMDGPLYYGENTITIKAVNLNGAVIGGLRQELVKEIRIYITDTNVSQIKKFMPVISSLDRPPLPIKDVDDYTADEMDRIFAVTPEFTLTGDKYVTSESAYDLVLRGENATWINIYLGTTKILTYDVATKNAADNPKNYSIDFMGDEDSFILRIQNIQYDAPGSHVYKLELLNSSGSPSSVTLDVTREVASFRVLSPKATVGNTININKNFVRFDIEAEGATEVIFPGKKESAIKRVDLKNRFVYDYDGLKSGKNDIKIQIKRADTTLDRTVTVYYTPTVLVDSQYMEKLGTKHSIFDKKVQLTFPKGIVLKASSQNAQGITKQYINTKLLFGIADPKDGVVERRNDYGNIIGVHADQRSTGAATAIDIDYDVSMRFANNSETVNFTRISDIYWINGGIGEQGDRGAANYKPATNGLPPYSLEGTFSRIPAERKVIPSARGTLTLKYDSSVVDEVGHTITVFRFSDNNQWVNIGGSVNAKAGTITVPFDEFGYYKVMKLRKGFSDVTNHGWARNILNGLYSKGIMTYLRTDEFGANDLITRGEFATLIVKGLNMPLNYSGTQSFFDIVPDARTNTWDYEHIETAARAGIIAGLDEGFFGADLRITREQAATMLARALSKQITLPKNDSKLESKLAKNFLDSGSIQYYARPAVSAMNDKKIMVGAPVFLEGEKKASYNFNPKSNLTRAEAGKIVVQLLEIAKTSTFPKNLS
ncbi:MAG: S-layer homology domain-containing protein [Candidatus Cohnella colombiensis]|uniref:S-layer homology domain-containing protein n=1 Tax=Candidatus Cohnella colombiensis TaxID=3121368 RepID=A0AA95JF70_9BACL|nr:MAG: S-layer homology domain-containing protein [Cohnella sp.]